MPLWAWITHGWVGVKFRVHQVSVTVYFLSHSIAWRQKPLAPVCPRWNESLSRSRVPTPSQRIDPPAILHWPEQKIRLSTLIFPLSVKCRSTARSHRGLWWNSTTDPVSLLRTSFPDNKKGVRHMAFKTQMYGRSNETSWHSLKSLVTRKKFK